MNMGDMSLYNSIKKHKLSYAGHLLRGSAGEAIQHILEGKMNSETEKDDRDECGLTARKTGGVWTRMKKLKILHKTDIMEGLCPDSMSTFCIRRRQLSLMMMMIIQLFRNRVLVRVFY